MAFLRLALAAIGLVSTFAFASPTDPRNGAEYTTLAAKMDVKAAAPKSEVVEFFMFHCPFCHQFAPELAAWVKKQGNAILFRPVYVPYSGPADPGAHLFLTLEAMGKRDAMFAKIEHAVHVEHSGWSRMSRSSNGSARTASTRRRFWRHGIRSAWRPRCGACLAGWASITSTARRRWW
jgi:thiol:disulfide interchange protein DsbA